MQLQLNLDLIEGYKNNSQKARVLTEDWVSRQAYCPNCGKKPLTHFKNNRPVADFFCQSCSEEFELKSKGGNFSSIINDGAYKTMIDRVQSDNHPNFFFLTYSKTYEVQNFLILPKQFITVETIIKRKPLAPTARRAGWIGCNIDLSQVPSKGRVFLVKSGQVREPELVFKQFTETLFIREQPFAARGWLLEILKCIDKIKEREFTLEQMYGFESNLKLMFPNNNHIKEKIRQQLQFLRDKEMIEFVGRGRYRKL
ncbi:DpnI domain-containing protein [Streptococcus panodentis]|uniref:Restriction endonuclease n=1 Tax=Streptococcus panodentis TaxID=1581472 RepID=A0ABS5AWE7_9STRE|nr:MULTISPECIES: DpnI domain-containing protein [Streptococcus]KXT84554.1 Type II restriction enzyme DpnI (dpnC) [Streptococcus sp. DD11]MBP2620897.1 restriction endonuclease [Streptococcus panodentis]